MREKSEKRNRKKVKIKTLVASSCVENFGKINLHKHTKLNKFASSKTNKYDNEQNAH